MRTTSWLVPLVACLLVAACGGSTSPKVSAWPGAHGLNDTIKWVEISSSGDTREYRVAPDGRISSPIDDQGGVVAALQSISMRVTLGGQLIYDGTPIAKIEANGDLTILYPPIPMSGYSIDENGTLSRNGKIVAGFDADGTLRPRLENDDDGRRFVAVSGKPTRRILMLIWAAVHVRQLSEQPRNSALADSLREGKWRVDTSLVGKAHLTCDEGAVTAIHGIVTQNDVPVAGVAVDVNLDEEGAVVVIGSVTDDHGCYFVGLDPGVYRISVLASEEYSSEPRVVTLTENQHLSVNAAITPID